VFSHSRTADSTSTNEKLSHRPVDNSRALGKSLLQCVPVVQCPNGQQKGPSRRLSVASFPWCLPVALAVSVQCTRYLHWRKRLRAAITCPRSMFSGLNMAPLSRRHSPSLWHEPSEVPSRQRQSLTVDLTQGDRRQRAMLKGGTLMVFDTTTRAPQSTLTLSHTPRFRVAGFSVTVVLRRRLRRHNDFLSVSEHHNDSPPVSGRRASPS